MVGHDDTYHGLNSTAPGLGVVKYMPLIINYHYFYFGKAIG